jgi:hypothetical protein
MKYHVLVGTHHKTGTVWMSSVFREIAEQLNVPYLNVTRKKLPWGDEHGRREALRAFITQAQGRVIVFDGHSQFPPLSTIDPEYQTHFRGIRMIRDPRDVAISAASYHARADEPWLHVPHKKFDGLTYQEKNRSFSTLEEKILFELDNSHRRIIRQMLAFDHQGVFRDVRYEDLIEDFTLNAWREVLFYLGFEDAEMETVLRAVWEKSLFGGKERHGPHVTSGAKEQWAQVFHADLLKRYVDRFGADLVQLGYPLVLPTGETSKAAQSVDGNSADDSVPDSVGLRDQLENRVRQLAEEEAAYNRMVKRLHEVTVTTLPANTIVLVVSRGDEELVPQGDSRLWHFPRTDDGLYWDGYPSHSAEAISQLEALRGKGASFIIFPSTAFWWLDYYSDFRDYLDTNYKRMMDDSDFIVHDLRTSGKPPN